MKNDINSLLSNAFKYSVVEILEPIFEEVVEIVDELVVVGICGIILPMVVFCLFGVSWKFLVKCWYLTIVAVGMTVEYLIDFNDCLVDNNLRDIFFLKKNIIDLDFELK